MKRILCIIICIMSMLVLSVSSADGFCSDPEQIETAAQSVMMLEIYDKQNDMIATGSGFVMFDNMTLITNYHVIENAAKIIADSDDGFQYFVTKILIADKEKDIAILQFMTPTIMRPLDYSSTEDIMRGSSVVAIGSPIGLKNTVSTGNISAVYTEDDVQYVQFTAPVSHGSSGGALFDDQGCVIGITSASWENGQNLNIAISIKEVVTLYNQWDGITSYGIDEKLSNTLNDDSIIDQGPKKPYYMLPSDHYTIKEISPHLATGDIICLGKYEQDGDTSNGSEGILWMVLQVKDKKAFCLSLYTLEGRYFYHTEKAPKWKGSDLRNWLNESFYNIAFSENEKSLIIPAALDSSGKRLFKIDSKSKDRVDNVTALTESEARKMLSEYLPERIGRVTQYSSMQIPTANTDSWWTASVESDGYVKIICEDYPCAWTLAWQPRGVRPAIWIDISE